MRKKPEFIARVESKHIKGCGALAAVARGDWATPWVTVPLNGAPMHVWLSKRGTRNTRNNRIWIRLICNDTQCTATAVVLGEAICALAPHGEALSRKSRRPSPERGT